MIPYGKQSLDETDVQAVVEILRSDWLTQGPAVERFERAIAEQVEARHAVAFSSGTSALHAAAFCGGLGPGAAVATSPLSFAASAACARYVGADIAFIDIDPDTLNMNLAELPPGLDGLVAVHYAGLPLALGAMRERPPVVIEDAAHALGATTPDGPVGNCARSDMTVFSLHPVKAITAGEGGVVTTNEDDLAAALRAARNHGIVRPDGNEPWHYEIRSAGWNYRLTDVAAALGTSQLRKLEPFIDRRNDLAIRYREELQTLPIELPPRAPEGWRHAYHLFPVRVEDRGGVYRKLHERDIRVQVHYVPIYRHPWYASFGDRRDFPQTERAYERLLSLPLYPAMTEREQDEVIAALRQIL